MSNDNEIATVQDFFDSWVVEEAARTYSDDYAGARSPERGIVPDTNLNVVLDKMFRKDEMVAASITTKVDALMSSGFYFEGSNSRNVERAERLVTRSWYRQLLFQFCLYGNAFSEIERTPAGTPVELHAIEPHTIAPHDEEGHGEVSFYRQRIGGETVDLPASDVYHFRMDRLSTGQWAEIPVKPIAQYVALKLFIKNHVTHLFKENMFRPVTYVEKGVTKDELDRVITHLKEARKDPSKPLVNFGDGKTEPYMKFSDGEEFRKWVNLCDNAILTQMQVPPIMAGVPDNSGRASGEQQTYKAFNTHIKGLAMTLEDQFDKFFEKAGLTGVEMHIGTPDSKSETDIVETALKLKSMGAKPGKLTQWLKDRGLDLDEDFFDEDVFRSESQADRNQESNAANVSSRSGKNDGEMNERVGTGDEGTTRDDQLVTEALDKHQVHANPQLEGRVRELLERFNE